MMRTIQEKLVFFRQFIRQPRQTGSVTPSSPFLAQCMLDAVPWERTRSLVELGAGTGAITRHIGRMNNNNTRVILFEKEADLRHQLIDQFPLYTCYDDAGKLQDALRIEGIGQVDCMLSGLPFFNFTPQVREQLMQQIYTSLNPGGLFIAFQYSQQMRKTLSRMFTVEHVHFVPLNIPPAFVYVCRKSDEESIPHES
ncbi:phospholipid methyltransferase [Paenibacillus filicis]|uniref:Phospholipid methyltransferase n=1 Tax=Paenibacillus filicis TaxID=669464 RepID=A0ABU9DRZ4_9BACL